MKKNEILLIGKGSTCMVYKKYDVKRRKYICSLKVIKKASVGKDKKKVIQLLREKNALLHLGKISKGENFEKYWITLLECSSSEKELDTLVDVMKAENLHWKDLLSMATQILSALSYFHRHLIIHRDIKANNVIVNTSTCRIKVIDFGRSKILGEENEHCTTFLSPGFNSPPELIKDPRFYCIKSESWALGMLILEMFTGKPVFGYRPVTYLDLVSFYQNKQIYRWKTEVKLTTNLLPFLRICFEELLQINLVDRSSVETFRKLWLKCLSVDEAGS
eukprot:snap_masked-scaffold_21-processed-gene-4.10-mRNA-1 protein AED:1.00 eAED:1.00 QI:0/0/0/0/1/1/4/0/275